MKNKTPNPETEKTLQDELNDALTRFNSLANTSQEGILIIDENYRIIYANNEMLKISGYEYSEIVHKDFRMLIADEDKAYVEERYRKRQAGVPIDQRYTVTMISKIGSKKRIALSAAVSKTTSGKTETIAHVMDITEKERIQKVLEHQLEFEQTIASISTIFINFSADRLDRMVNYALRKIAEVNEFDRGYIYMFSSANVIMELTHEWCRKSDFAHTQIDKELFSLALPWIVEILNRQENILVKDINDIPENAVDEKKFFGDRGVKSFLIVPLVFNQTLTGFIGFESFTSNKTWSQEDVRLMNIAAETIINAYKRKWSEQALKESEERFRGIYETGNIGIYRYNRYHVIEMANPALLNMLGYNSFDEFASVNLFEQVFADKNNRRTFEELLRKHGMLNGYETEWLTSDNTVIEMSENARAVKDEKGRFLYYEGFVENISEKKKARRLLIQAKEEAEKSSKMKTDFIQQMSHEIRTPITAIINNISMLKIMLGEEQSGQFNAQFNTISQGGMRLIRTIDMIVDMSEIQSGNYKPHVKEYDLYKDILRDQLEKQKDNAEAKDLNFTHNIADKLYPVVCDKYSVSQIFEQVIDNAVKFTENGGVKILLTEENENYILTVEDTGTGISEEYLPRIFEPFSQEEEGTNRRFEGNGLGLTIASELSKFNNCEINIESTKGEKTTATILIPQINS